MGEGQYPLVATRNVSPSGDSSGVTDVATLNAAIADDRYVRLTPGGIYYANAHLELVSHTLLIAHGATVNLVDGVLTNLLRNAAVAATRSVSDGSATDGSTTLTSATADFTAADVGAQVAVWGAARGSSAWYGTILAVIDAQNVTLSCHADVTIANAVVDIYGNRDSDITILGGSWTTPDLSAGTTMLTQYASCFRRIDKCTVRGMEWTTAGARSQGGRYALSFADVTDLEVENIYYPSTSGDGVHVRGPATGVTIRDIRGNTGDDMVSVGTAYANAISDTEGPLTNITVENIQPNGAQEPVLLYDLGVPAAKSQFPITGYRCEGVRGSTLYRGWLANGYPYITDTLILRDIDVATTASYPNVEVLHGDYISDIDVAGVAYGADVVASDGIVKITTLRGALRVRDLSMVQAPAGDNVGVHIVSATLGDGANFGSSVDLDGVYVERDGLGQAPATFDTLWLDGCAGTLQALGLRNIRALPTTAGTVLKATTSAPTIEHLAIADCVGFGDYLVDLPAGHPAAVLNLVGLTWLGTQLVSATTALTIRNADRPRSDLRTIARGLLAEPFPADAGAAAGAVASGSMYCTLLGVYAGDVISNVVAMASVKGTVSLVKAALVGSDQTTMLATSADFSGTWAAGINVIPLSAPYVVPADGTLYLAVLIVFSVAPSMLRGMNVAGGAPGVGAGISPAMVQQSLADLPGAATLVLSGVGFWLAAS